MARGLRTRAAILVVREAKALTTPQSPPPDDVLARRAQELEELRQAEHDSAFSGDQREVTGELSTVDQHPADTADFTYQRELQLTTQTLLERESAQVEAAMRAREQGTYGFWERAKLGSGAARAAFANHD